MQLGVKTIKLSGMWFCKNDRSIASKNDSKCLKKSSKNIYGINLPTGVWVSIT